MSLKLPILFVLAATLGLSSIPATAQPTLQFYCARALPAVCASGLSGGLALAQAARSLNGHITIVEHWADTKQDVDGDGAVWYELPGWESVRELSIWAAVDMVTGEYTIITPAGDPSNPPRYKRAYLEGNSGTPDRLLIGGLRYQALYVRPGVGAWKFLLGRSGDSGNASESLLTLELAAMHPIGASPGPPPRVELDDVVILLDTGEITAFAARIDQEALDSGTVFGG